MVLLGVGSHVRHLRIVWLSFAVVSCGGDLDHDDRNLGDECRKFDGDPKCGSGAISRCYAYLPVNGDGVTRYCRLECSNITGDDCPSGYACADVLSEGTAVTSACLEPELRGP